MLSKFTRSGGALTNLPPIMNGRAVESGIVLRTRSGIARPTTTLVTTPRPFHRTHSLPAYKNKNKMCGTNCGLTMQRSEGRIIKHTPTTARFG